MRGSRGLEAALACLLLVTATALPIVAAQDGPPGDDDGADDDPGRNSSDEGRDRGDERSDGEDEGDDEDEDEERARGRDEGLGHVTMHDSKIDGTYIQMVQVPDGLWNVTVRGSPLFDQIQVPGLIVEETRVDGASVRMEGTAGDADVELRIHDAPNAFSKIEADEGASVILHLAVGVAASQPDARTVNLVSEDLQVTLWTERGDLTVNGTEIRADGPTEIKLLVRPGSDGTDTQRNVEREIGDATVKGTVGAEVRMTQNRSGLRSQVVSFSDLNVLASRSERGAVVLVSSDNATARSVVLHLDPAIVDNASLRDVEVRLDGEVVPKATDLQDALDPNPEEGAEHVLVVGGEQIQAIVSVPGFSVHTIEVASLPGSQVITQLGLTPAQAATSLLAAALTVLVAAAVAGKRR